MLTLEFMTMLIRHLLQLSLQCLLVLSLATSPASSLGYVWCLSADGHTSLEAAMAGDCGLDNPVPTSAAAPAPALTGGADDCGPCLDISPSQQWGSPRTRQDGTPASFPAEFAAVTVAAHPPVPARLLNSPSVADVTLRTPDPILLHRTIVLLI
jgi:hypothetical protein